jgi:hypothetical protein
MNNISFEVLVKDETYRKIGTWKFQKRDAAKFMKIMNEQYGLGLSIKDLRKAGEDKDLDWLK